MSNRRNTGTPTQFHMTILDRTGTVVNNVSMTSEPDGIAFHVNPTFVVTNNTDGTMTRFDFPSNVFTAPPIQTLFAIGGFRGDLTTVGADNCLYLSQNGTRFADNTTSVNDSIVQICPGFLPPPGVANKCPLTQGFWKNHADEWPVTILTLGNQTYTEAQLLNILNTAPGGNASLILAHQLIASKLDIADGSNSTPIINTIVDADSLLSGFSGPLPYNVTTSSTVGQQMVNDANTLNSFNNGALSPNCTP